MLLTEYNEQQHIENEKRWSWEECQDAINKLINILMKEGRMEELKRSLEDKEYQNGLMKQYGLI